MTKDKYEVAERVLAFTCKIGVGLIFEDVVKFVRPGDVKLVGKLARAIGCMAMNELLDEPIDKFAKKTINEVKNCFSNVKETENAGTVTTDGTEATC